MVEVSRREDRPATEAEVDRELRRLRSLKG
jgi:hypothetical protein